MNSKGSLAFTTVRDAAALAASLESGSAAFPTEDVDHFLAENSWEARGQGLEEMVGEPTLSIVVLCFNNADVIGSCLDSLLRYPPRPNTEVIVVDNGSTDGSLSILEERQARGEIALVRNAVNGCSSGRNLGIAASRSEIVVFLDSDQRAVGRTLARTGSGDPLSRKLGGGGGMEWRLAASGKRTRSSRG